MIISKVQNLSDTEGTDDSYIKAIEGDRSQVKTQKVNRLSVAQIQG